MKFFSLSILAAFAAFAAVAYPNEPEAVWLTSRSYVGVAGGMLMPGGGASVRRAADVAVRVGTAWSDYAEVELEAACAPNASTRAGHEALSGVAARLVMHMNGWEAFDKLFGCERFDPFVTVGAATRFGARHAFADGSHRTATGPTVGVGAFYHLTDSLDLRFDAQAMLGIDSPCSEMYTVCIGIQWNFGGGGE